MLCRNQRKYAFLLIILLGIGQSFLFAETWTDPFTDGRSHLGFHARQPQWAPDAIAFITSDDPQWGYADDPVRNNPSGDGCVMRVGNSDGTYWGLAEATLSSSEQGEFEGLTDVRVEAWVYCLASPNIRARVGLYVRDTSDQFPDSLGNGEEAFPPQVHYDSSVYSGPGFGTSGFNTAVQDERGNISTVPGSSGYALVLSSGHGETRINDLFNRTVLTENRWIRMFAHAVGNTLTVGADVDGDGEYEAGPPGRSEIAFYSDIRNYDSEGHVIDANDRGRVGCFAVVTIPEGATGVPNMPALFDDVIITTGAAVTDWSLH